MSNVLPSQYRKNSLRRFSLRLIFAAAVAASMTGALALSSLIPSYFSLFYEEQAIVPQNGSLEASSSAARAVTETRDLVILSEDTVVSTTSAVDLLRLAVSLRPAGVTIDSIGYVRDTSGGQVLIGGSAKQASEIEAYRSALVASGKFPQVHVPVGSLAGTTNGSFSITLTSAP